MFKKSLVAAAMTLVAFGASAKTTVTTSATTPDKAYDVSSQGIPLTKAHTLSDVIVTLTASEASALAAGAQLRLTFNNAFVQAAPAAVPTYADTNGDLATAGNFTGSAYTVTSTSLTVPFNQLPVATTTLSTEITGDTITIANVPLLLASEAVGTSVSVTASIVTGAGTVVSSTTSATTKVIDVVDQFTVKVDDKFNAKIDVADNRESFAASPTNVQTDALVLDAADITGGATATEVKVTVFGDFAEPSFVSLIDQNDNEFTFNTARTEASFTYSTPGDFFNDVTLTATTKKDTVIPTNSFTVSVEVEYDDAEGVSRDQDLADKAAAGSWTLNGDSSAHVSFMPFSSAFAQSITLDNTGPVDGEVTVVWYYEGEVITTMLEAKAKAKSVTDISAEMKEMAAANGITGNASFDIIVNSPDGDINVSALYFSKADADRGIVLSESNSGQ